MVHKLYMLCFRGSLIITWTAGLLLVVFPYTLSFRYRMFRLRALSAVSVGLVQLSRRFHSGAGQGSSQRRRMLAVLAGVTGASASAGLLWKR